MTWLIVAAAVLFSIFCSRGPPADTSAPSIWCPSISYSHYTPKGSRYARVYYSRATARDDRGVSDIRQISPTNYYSGYQFPVRTYTITFRATDTSGNSNTCEFSFRVIARTCSYPGSPSHGYVSCNAPGGQQPVYGERCTFSCETGFVLQGSREQECGSNGDWSGGGSVNCNMITCPAPTVPANAEIEACTNGHNYDSVCVFRCREGFALPTGVERSVKCGADKLWSGNPAGCVDSQSPVIHDCPATQTVYADEDEDYTLASWTVPTVTDNVDMAINVELREGPDLRSKLWINKVYSVVYGAKDAAGNFAEECEFSISVGQITCEPLDRSFRLNIECADKLRYGSFCHFSCHQDYPMIGPSQAKCEKTSDNPPKGVWDWGDHDKPTFCERKDCPKLDEPKNGALACDTWGNSQACQMACEGDYDISRTAPNNGLYICQDTTGLWSPHEIVPDCTRRRRANTMNLPGELFYFGGDCSSVEAQEEIKRKFIEQLSNSLFRNLCTLYEDCQAENVKVRCEPADVRRSLSNSWPEQLKRSTSEVKITFEFVLNGVYDPELTGEQMAAKTAEQFGLLTARVTEYAQSGGLDIPGLTLEKDKIAFGEGNIVCDPGTLPNKSTFTCRACPTGMFFDAQSGNCSYCAKGTYQDEDGAHHCTVCPEGHSTEETGSKSEDMCKKVCPAGLYSTTGVVPCTPCPQATYTHKVAQLKCTPCPTGLHTISTGADSILNCTSEEAPVGPCSNRPCSPHGVCTSHNGTYQCHCKPDYSGNNCEITPDPCDHHVCQNGATCVRHGKTLETYTCQCSDLFAGELCEFDRVDGGWGQWSNWSECSATCDVGQQSRYRRCDSPEPNEYGNACSGDIEDVQDCYEEDCKVCEDLKVPDGVRLSCSEDVTGLQTCEVNCQEGLRRLREYPETLTCGSNADFTWTPEQPTAYLACTTVRFPRRLKSEYAMEFRSPPGSREENDALIANVVALVSESAPCVADGTCQTDGKVTTIDGNEMGQLLELKVNVELDEYDFSEGGIFDAEIENKGVEVISGFRDQLEKVSIDLNAAVREKRFTLMVNGAEYLPEEYSVRLVGKAECTHGETEVSFYCYTCPPGFYEEEGSCKLCDVGQFQFKAGKTECHHCAGSLTTAAKGSSNIQDCVPPHLMNSAKRTLNEESGIGRKEESGAKWPNEKESGTGRKEESDAKWPNEKESEDNMKSKDLKELLQLLRKAKRKPLIHA